MKADSIAEVGIDEQQRLYLRPATATFAQIYREAREVQWDAATGRLHSPKPCEWSYARWFQQIIETADAYGQPLRLTPATVWVNIPDDVGTEAEQIMSSRLLPVRSNQSMKPTAGRLAARLKDEAEMKTDRGIACRRLSPSR